MDRITRLFCWFLIVEMIVAGVGAISARWPDFVHRPEAISFLGWRIVFVLGFLPALLAYEVVRIDRRLRPRDMEISAAQRRTTQAYVAIMFVVIAGMQTWFAAILAGRQMLYDASPQVIVMVISGAVMAVYGNASAKFAPPTGPAAPDPGTWIRTSLRSGWAAVVAGLALMAAAFAPVGVRLVVILIVMPVAVAAALERRRLLRGGSGPKAAA